MLLYNLDNIQYNNPPEIFQTFNDMQVNRSYYEADSGDGLIVYIYIVNVIHADFESTTNHYNVTTGI